MDLRWGWLVVLLVAAVAGTLWWWLRRDDEDAPHGLPVAHVDRIRALPRYRALARQQLAWAVARLVATGLVLVGAILLAARPTTAVTEDPDAVPGDLVLCLDITPPQREADNAVLAQARTLLGGLLDERVGLYGFQDTTAELMPVTDDHAFAAERIHQVQTVLRSVEGGSAGAASAGDGLVSCVQHFDRPRSERGRAVVLLSTGQPAADPVHSLIEAGEYAARQGVVVYGLVPPGSGPGRADLRTAAELTGGRLLALDGPGALAQALQLERDRLDPPAVPVRRDDPQLPTVLVLVGLVALLATGVRGLLR